MGKNNKKNNKLYHKIQPVDLRKSKAIDEFRIIQKFILIVLIMLIQ